ncbi:hypothetical protein VE03_03516 [Pseudogymnoascus sp. 23342-1-I1]|nr:hypothetical protein VE03_03516 [Pseudogymnoascus sp. 23342-1-I1]
MGNSNSSQYDDREPQEFHSLPKSSSRGQRSTNRTPYAQQQNMGYRQQNQNGGQQRGYNQQQYSGNRARDDRDDDGCC